MKKALPQKSIDLKLILMIIIISALFTATCFAQPAVNWQRAMGGSQGDNFGSSVQTSDGGFIICGTAGSNDGDVSGSHGQNDVWLVKTDAQGFVQWKKCYGGSGGESGYSIQQTSDGGFIVGGITNSNNGDVSGFHGGFLDAWVFKTDNLGALQWKKCYGGSGNDVVATIKQTPDGGYIAAGSSDSNDGDVSGGHGSVDVWVIKLDATGTIQWQNCYGGTGSSDEAHSLQLTADGGYMFAGITDSNNGNVSGNHGMEDFWLFKTDGAGVLLWQKCFGGTGSDRCYSAIITSDKGFMLAGASASTAYNVGNPPFTYNYWLVKTDSTGTLHWQKSYGGTKDDYGYDVAQTNDGGYIVLGDAASADKDVACNINLSGYCLWSFKTDTAGVIQWQTNFGGEGYVGAHAHKIMQTSDGGYFAGGTRMSLGINSYPVAQCHGLQDLWVVKLGNGTNQGYIKGNIYNDKNHNCVKDGNDYNLGGIVMAMPGPCFAAPDALGNYTLYVDTGTYTLTHFPPTNYLVECPATTYTVNIPTPNLIASGYNYGDTAICPTELTINLTGSNIRPCFRQAFYITYCNHGIDTATNVQVNFTPNNPLLMVLSASLPYTVNGGLYQFNIGTLAPNKCGSIVITDSVSCNAVLGTTMCGISQILPFAGDCNMSNNIDDDCHLVTGSCDPNGKEVASQNFAANGYVTREGILASDTLTYRIHFQNTGTDTAFTVVLRDTLSTNLQVSSLTLLAASHPYSFKIYGAGIIEWTFNNILLPDSTTDEPGSHGSVKFSILQKAGNMPGTVITNLAGIWFDFNLPVNTNKTQNFIPIYASAPATICAGDSILLNGIYEMNAGQYPDTMQTALGCDSILTTVLSLNALPTVTLSVASPTVCVNAGLVALSGAPAGGVYNGGFVTSNNFDPTASGIGTFGVAYSYTDNNGCTGGDTKTISVMGCTGIAEYDSDMAVYPNPGNGIFMIALNTAYSECTITVTDLLGKKVFESTQKEMHIDLTGKPEGIYFVNVKTGNGLFVKKIVKQ